MTPTVLRAFVDEILVSKKKGPRVVFFANIFTKKKRRKKSFRK